MPDPAIEIELDIAPIRYRLEVKDPKDFNKELKKLKTFIKNNDESLIESISEVAILRNKKSTKQAMSNPIEYRLPEFFYKADLANNEAIALLLYFIDKPITTTS